MRTPPALFQRAFLTWMFAFGAFSFGCGTNDAAPGQTVADAGQDADGLPGSDVFDSADGNALPDTSVVDSSTIPDLDEESRGYAVPPRRWESSNGITHDVDRDLRAVLEKDRLRGQCDAWNAGARDEQTKLLCGKWMFFYETFGTVGIPKPLLTFAQNYYVAYYGPGFESFGFVADPYDADGMPIGLAETTGKLGDVETRAFTCASCHFGKMPDGRYAVGYGNLSLDYGRFIAGLGAPLAMSLNENSSDVHPDLRAELLPFVRSAKQQPGYQFAVAEAGIKLLGTGSMGSGITVEEQEMFLALHRGTMDFLTKPLVDDGVWTVSRILSLWNIPDALLREKADMEHERLSWTGGAKTLDSFISGFVAIGVADPEEWSGDRIEPLEAYLRSLRVPPREIALDDAAVERGAVAFVEDGCGECHTGPSGESAVAYSYDEIGTDSAMDRIFNPDANDELCCGFQGDGSGYEVTHGIKAPRLVGVENQLRWLHNGSVPSLDALLCLADRPDSSLEAMSSDGHTFGCGLPEGTRRDIIAYLRSL